MDELKEIQNWYHSQCNDNWEHEFGVSIETLDNPGWSVKIDLAGTELENINYREYSYGMEEVDSTDNNWLVTKKENMQFVGYGGPNKLIEILSVFIKWAKLNA